MGADLHGMPINKLTFNSVFDNIVFLNETIYPD